MIGDWLEDYVWVEAIVQAKIVSAGNVDSFVKVSQVTRARHAHQVSAHLKKKSYTQYIESMESGSQPEELEKWCDTRNTISDFGIPSCFDIC